MAKLYWPPCSFLATSTLQTDRQTDTNTNRNTPLPCQGAECRGWYTYEFESFATQFPLVPLVRRDYVGLMEVCVGLCSAVCLRHRLLNHPTRVARLHADHTVSPVEVRLHFAAGRTTGWTKRFEYSCNK